MAPVQLSVVCVVGAQRARARRLVAAVADQRKAPRLELILVDGAAGEDPIDAPGLDATHVPVEPGTELGVARATGLGAARGEIVAFLFDHCRPEPGWARALVDRYDGADWGAVGYGFTVADPADRTARTAWLAQFGPWLHRADHAAMALPGNNVSYRRSALAALRCDLAPLLDADANLHRALVRHGLRFAIEPAAAVRYENFAHLRETCVANLRYAWLQSARRGQAEHWGVRRRLLHGAGGPTLGFLVRVVESVSTLRRSPGPRAEDVACLPGMLAIGAAWAVGECCGCLLGVRSSARAMVGLERDAPRALDA